MEREDRLMRNELRFREINERLREIAERTGGMDGGPEFLCECADETCVERIRLSLAEYQTLRASPRRFVVIRGHERGGERVVADRGPYLIVEKRGGVAGEIAERGA